MVNIGLFYKLLTFPMRVCSSSIKGSNSLGNLSISVNSPFLAAVEDATSDDIFIWNATLSNVEISLIVTLVRIFFSDMVKDL